MRTRIAKKIGQGLSGGEGSLDERYGLETSHQRSPAPDCHDCFPMRRRQSCAVVYPLLAQVGQYSAMSTGEIRLEKEKIIYRVGLYPQDSPRRRKTCLVVPLCLVFSYRLKLDQTWSIHLEDVPSVEPEQRERD
jgi:hypothetical protein